MLVPAWTLSSPDLKLETNSSSLALNSRRHSSARSGHFSHGTFRPEGKSTAETEAATAAIQPSPRRSGFRAIERAGTEKSSEGVPASAAADEADHAGEVAG